MLSVLNAIARPSVWCLPVTPSRVSHTGGSVKSG